MHAHRHLDPFAHAHRQLFHRRLQPDVHRRGHDRPIEDGRYLTFEYIGAADHLAEAKPGIARERGRFCTSACRSASAFA